MFFKKLRSINIINKIMTSAFYMGGDFSITAARIMINGRLKHKSYGNCTDIILGDKRIRISKKHKSYLPHIMKYFDFYFEAVIPIEINGYKLVDYSTPRFHEVQGYDLHPVIFPSLAEPIKTAQQYIDFAQLSEGATVLDLGAYSGLTSMLFAIKAGKSGKVISVESDNINIQLVKKNFSFFAKMTGINIELLEGAVWENNNGLIFFNEGNIGSAPLSIAGNERKGNVSRVESFTLNTIAKKYNLKKVDFIKCDIEGAEAVIFKDAAFFESYKPRIIIEPHVIKGVDSADICTEQLIKYGYTVKKVKQYGADEDLLECYPS